MKTKLSYKIFLAFLLTSIVIVVLMTAIMGYFARRNFEDFVNRMEMERLDELITELSDFYRAHQGWGSLRGDSGIFHEMMKPDRQDIHPRALLVWRGGLNPRMVFAPAPKRCRALPGLTWNHACHSMMPK
jgi:hypothetical protein